MLSVKFKNVYLLFILTIIISGCATVKGDFQHASKVDSIQSYRDFLNKHPDTEFETAAQNRIRELEEEEAKRKVMQEKAEREAWEKAKHNHSVASYAEFLNSYPESKFAIEAQSSCKAIIQEIALKNVSGDKRMIKSGSEFPLHLFSDEDIIKGFTELNVGYFISAEIGPTKDQQFGFMHFRNFSEWDKFYVSNLNKVSNYTSANIGFDIRMAPITANVTSSINHETTVTFYRDPEYTTPKALRLSIQRNLSLGKVVNDETVIEGIGIGILKSGDSVEVYEFIKDGVSIF